MRKSTIIILTLVILLGTVVALSGCFGYKKTSFEELQPELYKVVSSDCSCGWLDIKNFMVINNKPSVEIVDMVLKDGKCLYLIKIK